MQATIAMSRWSSSPVISETHFEGNGDENLKPETPLSSIFLSIRVFFPITVVVLHGFTLFAGS